MRPQVFYSHTERHPIDRRFADLFLARLCQQPLDVWWYYRPEDAIPPGDVIRDHLVDRIQRSALVVVGVSATSMENEHVQAEMALALGCNKPIIPLLLQDNPPPVEGLAAVLHGLMWSLVTCSPVSVENAVGRVCECAGVQYLSSEVSDAPQLPVLRRLLEELSDPSRSVSRGSFATAWTIALPLTAQIRDRYLEHCPEEALATLRALITVLRATVTPVLPLYYCRLAEAVLVIEAGGGTPASACEGLRLAENLLADTPEPDFHLFAALGFAALQVERYRDAIFYYREARRLHRHEFGVDEGTLEFSYILTLLASGSAISSDELESMIVTGRDGGLISDLGSPARLYALSICASCLLGRAIPEEWRRAVLQSGWSDVALAFADRALRLPSFFHLGAQRRLLQAAEEAVRGALVVECGGAQARLLRERLAHLVYMQGNIDQSRLLFRELADSHPECLSYRVEEMLCSIDCRYLVAARLVAERIVNGIRDAHEDFPGQVTYYRGLAHWVMGDKGLSSLCLEEARRMSESARVTLDAYSDVVEMRRCVPSSD